MVKRVTAASMIALGTLCSCDVDFFGSDTKRIANGYRLTRVDWPIEFQFASPSGADPIAVAEIGWRKPIILVRAQGSRDWELIDTTASHRTTISDEQRRNDPTYSTIQLYSADAAWHLPRKTRRW
jgi:hypothetical protein